MGIPARTVADLSGLALDDPAGQPCALHRDDRATLLVCTTPGAAPAAYQLAEAVRQEISAETLAITFAVDLSEVPRIARAALRRQLKSHRDEIMKWLRGAAADGLLDDSSPWGALTLLTDWDGNVTNQLGFAPGRTDPLFLLAAPGGSVLDDAMAQDVESLLASVRLAVEPQS